MNWIKQENQAHKNESMRTINDVFNKYGLQIRSKPTNEELKRAIHHFTYDLIKSGEQVQLRDSGKKMKAIKIGNVIANHSCYRAIFMYASGIQVNDGGLFNKKFTIESKKGDIPDFLLELIMMRFDSKYMSDFVYFIRRSETFVEVALGQEGSQRRDSIEEYFQEEKLKSLFSPSSRKERDRKEELQEMVETEARMLAEGLSKNEGLYELKIDIVQFLFELMQEIVEEVKGGIK